MIIHPITPINLAMLTERLSPQAVASVYEEDSRIYEYTSAANPRMLQVSPISHQSIQIIRGYFSVRSGSSSIICCHRLIGSCPRTPRLTSPVWRHKNHSIRSKSAHANSIPCDFTKSDGVILAHLRDRAARN